MSATTATVDPPGQLELIAVAPAAPCTSYRVVTFDPASGCEIAPRGFPKFSDAIRDLPLAATRAAAAAAELDEPVWILGADNTSCEISPAGDVAPEVGWASLAARVLNNRKDPSLMPTKPKAPEGPVLTDIPLDKIVQHPHNIRVDLGDLTDLSKSINAEGYLVPGLVLPANDEGLHYLIDGHRRHGAGQLLDPPPPMPCLIRDLTEAQVIETMLATGIQRQDISAVEEARGYARLVELRTSYADIAEKMGRTQKHIKGRVKLLQLPPIVLNAVHTGALPLAQTDAILEHATDVEAMDWVANIVRGGLSHGWNARNALHNHVTTRDREAALKVLRDEAAAEGVTEMDRHWYPPTSLGSCQRAVPLDLLMLTAAQTRKHTGEPCHAAHIGEDYCELDGVYAYRARRIDVCTDPARHTTLADDDDRSKIQMKPAVYEDGLREPQADPDAAERAAQREARAAAQNTRHVFVQTMLIEGNPPAVDPFTAAIVCADKAELAYEICKGFLLAPGDDEHSDSWQEDRWYRWAGDPAEISRAVWAMTLFEAEHTYRSAAGGGWLGGPDEAAVAERAAVAYIDHITGAGYKLSDAETADIAEIRERIEARTEQAVAKALAADQRSADEADPTLAIAEARLGELTPDALIAFAELAAWDPHQAPRPLFAEIEVDAMIQAGVAHLVHDDDGGELFVTDFGRKAIELVDAGTTTGFAGLVDEAAAVAGAD